MKQADIIREEITSARVILSGEINKPVTVKGLKVTKGAQAAIEPLAAKSRRKWLSKDRYRQACRAD